MKVYWHIGVHKTATTSLQSALLEHVEKGGAGFHYPRTPEAGPGHAELAWRFLGLNGRTKDAEAVVKEIESARSAGFTKIVLSSEEFSRAVLLDGQFRAFAAVSGRFECELIITLRPLRERVYPECQELMKHGRPVDLTSAADLLAIMGSRPGLRPDFLPSAVLESQASSISIIMVDRQEPEKVFRAMSEILGETILPTRMVANRSQPFVQTAWLDVLNRHALGLPYRVKRDVARAAFDKACAVEPSIREVPYPDVPPSVTTYLDSVWNLQLHFLNAVSSTHRVRCF